jgi:TRAP-type transport system small permease protein
VPTKLLDGIEKVQNAILTVVYIMTIVVVSFQVINRFVLQWPVVWTADLAVVCFIWLGFFAASQAVRANAHFRMAVLLERKWKGSGRQALEWIALLATAAMSVILFVAGLMMTIDGLHETAPGLNVSMAWAYSAVPVSSFTALLFAIEKMVELFKQPAPLFAAPLQEQL